MNQRHPPQHPITLAPHTEPFPVNPRDPLKIHAKQARYSEETGLSRETDSSLRASIHRLRGNLDGVLGVEDLQSLLDAGLHGLLTLTNPDAGVVVLLVGLVSAVRVADLRVEVLDLAGDVVTDTAQVGPLQVSVEVDLDDTVADGLLELGVAGAGATVEDEEDWG